MEGSPRDGRDVVAGHDVGSASVTIFEPEIERQYEGSQELGPRNAPNLYTASDQLPERELAVLAMRMAVVEKAVSRLGTLAFIWATVVLLGGFAVVLHSTDFWFVTVIIVVEGARIFGRSSELEWQHQSTWTMVTFRRQASSQMQRFGKYLARTASKTFSSSSTRHTTTSTQPTIPALARRFSVPAEVALMPYYVGLFLVNNLGVVLLLLQIGAAAATVTLSIVRLANQDYGSKILEIENGVKALNLFYALALAEATLFLLEMAYWIWNTAIVDVIRKVDRAYDLGDGGDLVLQRFMFDAYSQSLNNSIFDSVKMDIVGFADDLLSSEFDSERLIGVRILDHLTKHERFAMETLRKLGTSERATERLVQMFNWKSPANREIRVCAASIMSKLTGMTNSLRIISIPGSIESISSLLQRSSNIDAGDALAPNGCSGENTNIFNLLGVQILQNLSVDAENSEKIGSTREILSMIIDFTSGARHSLVDGDEAAVKMIKRSLQLMKTLVRTKGNGGKVLRRRISENVFTVSNIREVLTFGDQHRDIQELAVDVLISLAMDEHAREAIGCTGGMIRLLLKIFFAPGITESATASDEAGEALATLTLKSERNCAAVVEEGVLEKLMWAAAVPILQLHACRIMRNLCAYSGRKVAAQLRNFTGSLPTVLRIFMTSQKDNMLLEVSIGLVTELCLLLPPASPGHELSNQLQDADIKEAKFLERLVQVLQHYKYPETKVPRIRRFVIQQVIWMMQCGGNTGDHYAKELRKLGMKDLLESVALTTSELENYHIFSGSVGICQHRVPISSLLETAVQLLKKS